MPQENYRLIELDWEKTIKAFNRSTLISGDATPTKGKICMYFKTKDDEVSFQLTEFGYLQISHPNGESLRRARSKLKDLVVAEKWIPTDVRVVIEPRIVSNLRNRRLNDLELEWLFRWDFYFRKRDQPPDKRVLRKISTKETFDAPLHDIELYKNEIITHQNFLRFPFESPKIWSWRHGYKYNKRQYTENELLAEDYSS